MSGTSETLRRAWRKRRRGEPLTDEERAAVNGHQRKQVKHDLYFRDAAAKQRLQDLAAEDGYSNLSSWILDRVEAGIAAHGVDATHVAQMEKELEKVKKQHDQLNELYVETASKSLEMQEENRKLSKQLARLLRHIFPEDAEEDAEP